MLFILEYSVIFKTLELYTLNVLMVKIKSTLNCFVKVGNFFGF
jgi:hypothetical protein